MRASLVAVSTAIALIALVAWSNSGSREIQGVRSITTRSSYASPPITRDAMHMHAWGSPRRCPDQPRLHRQHLRGASSSSSSSSSSSLSSSSARKLVARSALGGAADGGGSGSPGPANSEEAHQNKIDEQTKIVNKIIEIGEAPALETYLKENLAYLDQDFWMTYMKSYDGQESEEGKKNLQSLANTVMKITQVLVEQRRQDETMERIAIVDRLVEDFLRAQDQDQLEQVVRARIGMLTQDNNFWSRVAHRYDSSTTDEEKARVSQMARDVQAICQKLANAAGQSAAGAEESLKTIMAAGANEQGEWFLPLTDDEVTRMRKVVEDENGGSEQMVGLALAWMKRASEAEEQEVSMIVAVIQKVLHLVSAVTLSSSDFERKDTGTTAEQLLDQILQAREEQWDNILTTLAAQKTVSGSELMQSSDDILQKILFSLPAGSNKQAVLVEYVQEIQTRIRKAYGLPSATVV
uniref:Uncharacterized protein n=1 Tax=Lotharella globosa TaxID=91324 RepID=A0A7S4DLY1_9EUKA